MIVIIIIFLYIYRSIYTVWQTYLSEEEKAAKFRASQYEQIAQIYDSMKQGRSHKVHSGKKGLDNYLKYVILAFKLIHINQLIYL